MPETKTKTEPVVHTWADIRVDRPMSNIERRQVVTQNMMLAQIRLTQGFFVPSHSHDGEQVAVVIQGKLKFSCGEPGSDAYREYTVGGGQTIELPPNVPHAVEALEDSLVFDLFSPPVEKMGVDMKDG